METIFDHNPNAGEIERIAFNYLDLHLRCGQWVDSPTKDWYLTNIKPDWAIFDLALLFTERGDQETANAFWDKIPAIAQEYRLGFDYEMIEA